MLENMEEVIRSFASTEEGKMFLAWIFKQANLDDFSITGETSKDYYLLGRQSLANDIRNELKKYAIDSYCAIVREIEI